MNIFEVLSQGNSKLHEVSMSAMLAYLLDSKANHGLSDTFTRVFLSECRPSMNGITPEAFVRTEVELEVPYDFENKRNVIDIELRILSKDNNTQHRIIIENKIKSTSVKEQQLNGYYQALLQDGTEPIAVIFLTPSGNNIGLSDEFNSLSLTRAEDSKHWFKWDGESSISSMIREILTKESNADISPINDYVKHTLKAFARHIDTSIAPNPRNILRGEDLGDIIDETEITIGSQHYRIIRRDSTQIQLINLQTGEKVVAKPLLRQFIKEKALGISESDTYILNTRQLGKRIFDMINLTT